MYIYICTFIYTRISILKLGNYPSLFLLPRGDCLLHRDTLLCSSIMQFSLLKLKSVLFYNVGSNDQSLYL